jgi:hypothetical protein
MNPVRTEGGRLARRAALVAALTAALLGGSAQAARASLDFYVFADTPPGGALNLDLSRPTNLAYYLAIGNYEPNPAQFSVGFDLPRAVGDRNGGSTIAWSGQGSVASPSITLGLAAVTTPAVADNCRALSPGRHGYHEGSYEVDVSMPANSSGILTFYFQLGEIIPRRGDTFGPTFLVRRQLVNGSQGTIPQDLSIPAPSPVNTGPVGVDLAFKIGRRTAAGTPVIRGGQRLVVKGGTNPRLRRQVIRVLIRKVEDVGAAGQAIGKVRTDKRGRFRFVRRAPKPGSYELGLAYASQRPEFASDFSCSKPFQVVK